MVAVAMEKMPRCAYLHIPFCRRRCYYCDFPVSVVGDRKHGDNSGTIQKYVDTLCREIQATPATGVPLQTVFFGGGTPSLLSLAQVTQILETLKAAFGIEPDAEISMEIDPGTFDRQQLEGFLQRGINRFSLGVQAFQDPLLQVSGRSHSVADIHTAIQLIHTTGISNFSIDLMAGLPHQTLADWKETLHRAIATQATHISVYDLIVEPKTPFARYYQSNTAPLPPEATTVEMYRQTCAQLTAAGYQHYEISNYAKPGYQCLHNRAYWENQPYYGFGMGATSYLYRRRLTRGRTLKAYKTWVQNWENHNVELPPPDSLQDQLLETVMLGLRLAEGISLPDIAQKFGEEVPKAICRSLQTDGWHHWVELTTADNQLLSLPDDPCHPLPENATHLRLQDPEGFLLSNSILASLFRHLSVPA
ncbi:radical SAM family heme chaperone HemW [Geitlerinema sp. PCC 9228]|jgi:oxygen-independent coproporphyrinogen-3 oxidase|uniref:radical SAM family heme chaperone HemW n=1 Tax=Geitlerinema sp. PCC 9228 TaxID=111611 RepID=UPI0008F992BA|nr:radical SAM family heme chaperone HemW [Geitlerinema sp. PCC 9228]